jgi:hypothetical protein
MKSMRKRDRTAASGEQELPEPVLPGREPAVDAPTNKRVAVGTLATARALREEDTAVRTFEWLTGPLVSTPSTDARWLGHVRVNDPALQDRLERLEGFLTREIMMVRSTGAESLSVVLKPDARTELHLHVQRRDGQIEAEVCCEQGDVAALGTHWRLLQDSLAEHQVRLLPLRDHSPDWLAGPNPQYARSDAGESPARERRESQTDSEPPAPGDRHAHPSSPARAAHGRSTTHRGWETWA